MQLTLVVTELELRQVLVDILPLRLTFGSDEDPPWLRIDTVESLELLPRRGLRMVGPARVHYPLPLLSGDFTIEHVVLEMVPAIVSGDAGPVLAFKLDVVDFEVKYLPAFVDERIARKINAELCEHVAKIAWDFSKSLTRTIDLHERLSLVRQVTLGPPGCEVEVGEDFIALRIGLPISFAHDPVV